MNLLAAETSPYLLQHADNPVHWRPWGQAALNEAAARNIPVLLSVGYAACHWCHVMAHESFEDADTATLMNSLFVCVKVDREERPDIDHIYMSALHALGEQGGWPLTMFLRPDGAPFWGGTYFPPTARFGRPSFSNVLRSVAAAYADGAEVVEGNAAALRHAMSRMAVSTPGDALAPADLDAARTRLLSLTDPVHGGLKGAPKFPNPAIFRFLWQDAFRSGDTRGKDALRLMLRKMADGGIHDQLGGGFARYSVDAVWLAPHFEKMLYDNAQLLELLALAHADQPDPVFAGAAAGIVTWLTRDMLAEPGASSAQAFAASEDADSEGVEGKFYVFDEAELDAVLGPDAAAFKRAYDVTADGNWEDHTILRRVTARGDAAAEAALAISREKLLAVRDARIRPGRDDKVLADWNGMMIAALCRASAVFARPGWLTAAERAMAFLSDTMRDDGRIAHAYRLRRIAARGLLDDQAHFARAAIALFEATGRASYLASARAAVAGAELGFADNNGAFHQTASDAADVPVGDRPRIAADNATPSGNGIMAEVYAKLFHLTGAVEDAAKARGVIAAFSGNRDGLSAMPTLLAASDLLERGACVATAAPALLAVARTAADPSVCVLPGGDHPLGAVAEDAATICRAGTCGLPIRDPETLRENILLSS